MNRIKRHYLSLIVFITFIGMIFWNYTTPLFNDDEYAYNLSFRGIIQTGISDYFHWNSRFIGQTIFRFLVNMPLGIESVLNAFVFVLFTYLILIICKTNKKDRNVFNYLFVLILIFGFTSDFAQIYIWRAGSGNYLWTMVFDLLFIFLVKSNLIFKKNCNNIFYVVALSTFGIIVGETNENTVGGVIIISVFYIFFNKISIKKYIAPIFGVVLGYIILLMGPGDWQRANSINPYFHNLSLFGKIKFNFYDLLRGIYHNEKYIIFIFILLLILNLIFVKDIKLIFESLSWFITGVLMAMVLLASAGGASEPRTHFGTFVFMVIATVFLFNNFLKKSKLKIVSIGIILILGILTSIKVIEGIVDSYKTNISIDMRNQYIQKEKNKGNNIIYVNLLSYFGHTKYSITYDHLDFNKDSNNWVNKGTAIKFKVKKIILK